MGLDIRVNRCPSDVIDNLSELENPLIESMALRILEPMNQEQKIRTRTGGYSGLHVLRKEYARMKGWKTEDLNGRPSSIDDENCNSHLINHSDCDGWYLPDDFPEPQWIVNCGSGETSIGSSKKLLDELMELLAVKEQWPEEMDWKWDALFIAAVASRVTWTPVEFS